MIHDLLKRDVLFEDNGIECCVKSSRKSVPSVVMMAVQCQHSQSGNVTTQHRAYCSIRAQRHNKSQGKGPIRTECVSIPGQEVVKVSCRSCLIRPRTCSFPLTWKWSSRDLKWVLFPHLGPRHMSEIVILAVTLHSSKWMVVEED